MSGSSRTVWIWKQTIEVHNQDRVETQFYTIDEMRRMDVEIADERIGEFQYEDYWDYADDTDWLEITAVGFEVNR